VCLGLESEEGGGWGSLRGAGQKRLLCSRTRKGGESSLEENPNAKYQPLVINLKKRGSRGVVSIGERNTTGTPKNKNPVKRAEWPCRHIFAAPLGKRFKDEKPTQGHKQWSGKTRYRKERFRKTFRDGFSSVETDASKALGWQKTAREQGSFKTKHMDEGGGTFSP